uniref:Uncharacterized protein n=1 Tax=Bacteriophage sp. TaxID=38018 RepID=A0A8D9PE09_9VIRU|nr:MAG TPA: hypothetical protein [Bacteriophage sp.]
MYSGQFRDSGFKYQELQKESGTETHTLAATGTGDRKKEGKKARAEGTTVAAAQRQPLARVPVPNATHRAVPGRIKAQEFEQGRNRHARFRRHSRKSAGRGRRGVRARILAGNSGIQHHRARAVRSGGVQFQGGGRARCGQRTILQNSFPRGAGRAHVHGMRRRVVILDDVDFPGVQPQAARPFPHIPHKVRDSGGAVVMPPTYRTGTRQRPPVLVVVSHAKRACTGGKRARFMLGFMMLAPPRISARLKARLEAQRPQQRPFGIRHEVPARTLFLAIRYRTVKVQVVSRVHARQAHTVAINNRGWIHADEKLAFLYPVDNKGRMRPRQPQVRVQIFNIALRDTPHIVGVPAIVIQHGHKTARGRFHAGPQGIFRDNGRHVLFLRLGFLNSPQNQPHGGHILFIQRHALNLRRGNGTDAHRVQVVRHIHFRQSHRQRHVLVACRGNKQIRHILRPVLHAFGQLAADSAHHINRNLSVALQDRAIEHAGISTHGERHLYAVHVNHGPRPGTVPFNLHDASLYARMLNQKAHINVVRASCHGQLEAVLQFVFGAHVPVLVRAAGTPHNFHGHRVSVIRHDAVQGHGHGCGRLLNRRPAGFAPGAVRYRHPLKIGVVLFRVPGRNLGAGQFNAPGGKYPVQRRGRHVDDARIRQEHINDDYSRFIRGVAGDAGRVFLICHRVLSSVHEHRAVAGRYVPRGRF